jgi:AcrR family transcriptional regulator
MTLKKRSYHHGQLRQALVECAYDLISSQGIKRLSLRRVAQLLGVSQSALYSHFRDKDDLLLAVAALGFERLRDQLVSALLGARGAGDRAAALAHAYLMFALGNRDLFALMFQPKAPDEPGDMGLDTAAEGCIALIESVLEEASAASSGAPHAQWRLNWALLHGMASLMLAGRLDPERIGIGDGKVTLGALFEPPTPLPLARASHS